MFGLFAFFIAIFAFLAMVVAPILAYYYADKFEYGKEWAVLGCFLWISGIGQLISLFTLLAIIGHANRLGRSNEVQGANLVLWGTFGSIGIAMLLAVFSGGF
jgi:hypothetical protein